MQAAAQLKTNVEGVPSAIEKLQAEKKEADAKLAEVAEMREKADAQQLLMAMQEIAGIHVVAGKANVEDMDALRGVADLLLTKMEGGVIVLACVNGEKVNLVVKASKDATKKGIHAGKIIKEAAAVVGGGGGGRPDMAQAGGRQPEKLQSAVEKAVEVIKGQLG